jgi:hypothetical protein
MLLTANQVLAGDMYYETLEVGAGVTLTTNGFRIFVHDTLTLDQGAIIDQSGGTATMTAASALASGTVGGGGAGQPPSPCSATGGSVTNSLGGSAGAVGASIFGVATPPTAAAGGSEVFDSLTNAIAGRSLDGNLVVGGAGGSSCGMGNLNGGGGGVIVIVARTVVLSGTSATLSANGGPAAAAAGSPDATPVPGGGGVIVVVTTSPTPAHLTLSVQGGAPAVTGTSEGVPGHTYWLN